MNTIFLLASNDGLDGRIARWLATNLMTKAAHAPSELAPEQTLTQFITKGRQTGIHIFTGISDSDMEELVAGPVGQMDVHRIVTVPEGAEAADFGISTFVLKSDINDYALFTKLAGIKRLVQGREKGEDERPKLPWE